MKELIELRTFCELEIEKANGKLYSNEPPIYLSTEIQLHERVEAFSEVIERLDLILNNSVVKPCERRSPTDETFSGCKPPDERQNPQEEKSECSEDCHNSAIKVLFVMIDYSFFPIISRRASSWILPFVLRLCVCLPLAQGFNLPTNLMGQIAQNCCYTLARLIK